MTYCTCRGWLWWWKIWWNDDWQGKPKYSEKTCPSATLSTTNPTWTDPGSNAGRRGGKSAINSLSYGAALRKDNRLNRVKRIDLTRWNYFKLKKIHTHNAELKDSWNSVHIFSL
jgi:hypothetical protein